MRGRCPGERRPRRRTARSAPAHWSGPHDAGGVHHAGAACGGSAGRDRHGPLMHGRAGAVSRAARFARCTLPGSPPPSAPPGSRPGPRPVQPVRAADRLSSALTRGSHRVRPPDPQHVRARVDGRDIVDVLVEVGEVEAVGPGREADRGGLAGAGVLDQRRRGPRSSVPSASGTNSTMRLPSPGGPLA